MHKLNGKKKKRKDNNNKKKKRRDEPKMAELKLSKIISTGVKHRFPRMIAFHRENLLHRSVIFPALGKRKMQNSIAEYFVQITTCVWDNIAMYVISTIRLIDKWAHTEYQLMSVIKYKITEHYPLS